MQSRTNFWKIAAFVFGGSYLCAGQLDRSEWNCNIDSWDTTDQVHDCAKAIDGNENTFWFTQYYPYSEPLPHYFKIDLGQVYQTISFTYLPRQDGNLDGNIGSWQISLSADDESWRLLNGTWSDDQQLKTVDFRIGLEPCPARYFRLTAYTEAGSRGLWSSAAEFNIFDTDSFNAPSITSTHSAIDDPYQVYYAPPASFMTSTRSVKSISTSGSISVKSTPTAGSTAVKSTPTAGSTSVKSTPTSGSASVKSTPKAGSASGTSTQQSSKSDSGKNDQGGGLNTIQTIFTVIGSIAGVIAVVVAITVYRSG
ncbi:MAG: hypothetical protein Q9201_004067 [Fulgogasparrea decipioides]